MDTSFLDSEEFKRLESEYKFLSHAREKLRGHAGELESGNFSLIDLETTGLNPQENEIIEIGSMKISSGELKGVFNKLVRPKGPLSEEITRITGITREMLEGCPEIGAVLPELLDFIGNDALIAHNAEFDMAFLQEGVSRHLNRKLDNRVVCTLSLARAVLPNLDNHKLHTIARYFKIEISARHRAIGDVEATYQIWLKLVEKLQNKGVATMNDLEKYLASHARQAPF